MSNTSDECRATAAGCLCQLLRGHEPPHECAAEQCRRRWLDDGTDEKSAARVVTHRRCSAIM